MASDSPWCSVLGCAARATGSVLRSTVVNGRQSFPACDAHRDPVPCDCAARSMRSSPWLHACSRCTPVAATDYAQFEREVGASCGCAELMAAQPDFVAACSRCSTTPTPRIPHPPADSYAGAPPHTPGVNPMPTNCSAYKCGRTAKGLRDTVDGNLPACEDHLHMHLGPLPTPGAFSSPCACRPQDKQVCDACQRESKLDARIANATRRIERQEAEAAMKEGPRRMVGLDAMLQSKQSPEMRAFSVDTPKTGGVVVNVHKARLNCLEAQKLATAVQEAAEKVAARIDEKEPPVVTPHFAMGVLEQARENGGLTIAVESRILELANLIVGGDAIRDAVAEKRAWEFRLRAADAFAESKKPVVLPPLCHGQMELDHGLWTCAACGHHVTRKSVEAAAAKGWRLERNAEYDEMHNVPMPRSTP